MQNQLFEKKSFIIPLCSKFAGLLISLLTTCIFLQAAKVDKIAAGGSHSLIPRTVACGSGIKLNGH